jgi:hypothetical protein
VLPAVLLLVSGVVASGCSALVAESPSVEVASNVTAARSVESGVVTPRPGRSTSDRHTAAGEGAVGPATRVTTTTSATATSTTVAPRTTTTMPPTTVAPTTVPAPAPCHIAYLADSVGVDLLRNGLGKTLGGVGCTIEWSRAARGSRLVEGVQALRVATAEATGTDTVLVLQGYSKATANRAQFPSSLELLMEAAGGRAVVWSMYGPTIGCSSAYTETLTEANRLLQEATQRWPNLRLADYPALLAAHPEFSVHDCPHLRDSGSAAVAAWLAGEVRRLVELPPRPVG